MPATELLDDDYTFRLGVVFEPSVTLTDTLQTPNVVLRIVNTWSSGGGGSDGPCEDDRPDTGMLYPRG